MTNSKGQILKGRPEAGVRMNLTSPLRSFVLELSIFMTTRPLIKYAWLSVGAALVTLTLKLAAWWMTGSVGLLSDALESLVNLAAALLALLALWVAAKPPDEEHA